MAHPFLERIKAGPLLCDGAMGTMLHARGMSFDGSFDGLNLTHRELVVGVHRDYIAAGADIIETNTFGGNRYRLAEHRPRRAVCATSTSAAPSTPAKRARSPACRC